MKQPKISAALDHQFRQVITAGEREKFGDRIPDPAEHVAFIDEILEQVREGWTIHRGQWIRVVVPRQDRAEVAAVAAEVRQARRGRSRFSLAAVIGGALLAVWIVLRLLSPDSPESATTAQNTPTGAPATPVSTPTLDNRPTATPIPVPT